MTLPGERHDYYQLFSPEQIFHHRQVFFIAPDPVLVVIEVEKLPDNQAQGFRTRVVPGRGIRTVSDGNGMKRDYSGSLGVKR